MHALSTGGDIGVQISGADESSAGSGSLQVRVETALHLNLMEVGIAAPAAEGATGFESEALAPAVNQKAYPGAIWSQLGPLFVTS